MHQQKAYTVPPKSLAPPVQPFVFYFRHGVTIPGRLFLTHFATQSLRSLHRLTLSSLFPSLSSLPSFISCHRFSCLRRMFTYGIFFPCFTVALLSATIWASKWKRIRSGATPSRCTMTARRPTWMRFWLILLSKIILIEQNSGESPDRLREGEGDDLRRSQASSTGDIPRSGPRLWVYSAFDGIRKLDLVRAQLAGALDYMTVRVQLSGYSLHFNLFLWRW